MEQLSPLLFRRGWAGASECRLGRDFLSRPCGMNAETTRSKQSWYPPFAKCAQDGAPTGVVARQPKGRATRPNMAEAARACAALAGL